jgi:hypothetical protein
MPKKIEFRNQPNDGFPSPPGLEITRAIPMPAAMQGVALSELRQARIKAAALDQGSIEDDNNMDSGKS